MMKEHSLYIWTQTVKGACADKCLNQIILFFNLSQNISGLPSSKKMFSFYCVCNTQYVCYMDISYDVPSNKSDLIESKLSLKWVMCIIVLN